METQQPFLSWLALGTVGDSKTSVEIWQPYLLASLRATNNWDLVTEMPSLSGGGWTAATLAAQVDTWLASLTHRPDPILINIGYNDVVSGESQATFEADFGFVLDHIHAARPKSAIFVAKPWGGSGAWDTQLDLLDDTYIPNVLSTRSWASNGPDERIVLKPDALNNFVDGVHYSDLGAQRLVAAWLTTMGF